MVFQKIFSCFIYTHMRALRADLAKTFVYEHKKSLRSLCGVRYLRKVNDSICGYYFNWFDFTSTDHND